MKQWHPLFARLLRPLMEHSYDMYTDVPVGDLPRQADILLLRRKNVLSNPFEGVWRFLSPWNVLEFKGPSVKAQRHDLDSLVELGLAITRRLNEQAAKEGKRQSPPGEVSFWYLANHLSSSFIQRCQLRIGRVEAWESGLWHGELLNHPLYFVSRADLPVESDSIPLHLVAEEPVATATSVGRYLLDHDELWKYYGEWFAALHPAAWDEVKTMAAAKNKKFGISLDPIIEQVGIKELIKRISAERFFVEEGGLRMIAHQVPMKKLLSGLTAAQRQELKKLLK